MGLQLYQKNLLEKLKESLGAVLPIIGIVLVLCFSIAPIPNSVLMTFVVGAVLLIIGMMFFTLGAEMAMTPMGERIGTKLTNTRKISVVIVLCFILGLTFFVPKIFTAIAFDSGGVASGPMTATFLLPFSMGACEALGGNVVTDAFGVVAMLAMTPLITIQILGLIYQIQEQMKEKQAAKDYTSIKICIENLDNVDNQEIIEL